MTHQEGVVRWRQKLVEMKIIQRVEKYYNFRTNEWFISALHYIYALQNDKFNKVFIHH